MLCNFLSSAAAISRSTLRDCFLHSTRTGIADRSGKAGSQGAGRPHPGICGEPAGPFSEAGYPGYGQHRCKTECGGTALR